MSEQINKVLASTAQSFTTAQQAQARDNIDAQQSIAWSYDTASAITAINGSAVGGGMTGIDHDGNLSGSGTTASPLGLSSGIDLDIPARNVLNPGGHIRIGSLETWSGSLTYSPKIEMELNEYNGLQASTSAIMIRHPAAGFGDDRIITMYNYDGALIQTNYGSQYLYEGYYSASGLNLIYLGDTGKSSNWTYSGAYMKNNNSSLTLDGSSIEFAANGSSVTVDYKFFTSLSAWATAQGWTP